MKLENGNLILLESDFEKLQSRIDDEGMDIQQAFECELNLIGVPLRNVYTIETTFKDSKKHMYLYACIASKVNTGRKKI